MSLQEERISQMERETRVLHERIADLEGQAIQKDDELKLLREQSARNWDEYLSPREAQIIDLERENNMLRKLEADALATTRQKRDEYDALCNELGELGVDIPKLRAGRIKVVKA